MSLHHIPFPQASELIARHTAPLEVVSLPHNEAQDHVLARDVLTHHAYPDVKKAAVDGFAISEEDRLNGVRHFTVQEQVGAGHRFSTTLTSGKAIHVMTGAEVPENSGFVVRVEDAVQEGDHIALSQEYGSQENICQPGEEAHGEDIALKAGTWLNWARMPLIHYLGATHLSVYRKPRVGIIVTGDELLESHSPHQRGKVRNTNQYTAQYILQAMGIPCTSYGMVQDSREQIATTIRLAMEECDVVLTSGGVSMGKYDFVKPIFQSLDVNLHFTRTAIRPGGPLLFASRGKQVLFGLPGYPSAFFTVMLVYVVPALKRIMGRPDHHPVEVDVELDNDMRSRQGHLVFNRANFDLINGHWHARGGENQKSSHFIPFANADGLVIFPEDIGNAPRGTRLRGMPFALQLL